VNVLTKWHLVRLRIYAGEEETWRKVEWIGFETVPLLTEVTAIRRAIKALREELRSKWGGASQPGESRRDWWDKKFWISSAYPNGLHSQLVPGGHASIDDVLEALISSNSDPTLPPADGIGINCTHPSHIASLTQQFTGSAKRLHPLAIRPTFVLYPDGGAVYDTTSRTWTNRTTEPGEWARGVCAVAKELEGAKNPVGSEVWGGVIVGGCCKAGFPEIEYLRKELDG
jgi:homocysteine S-methyltransferase